MLGVVFPLRMRGVVMVEAAGIEPESTDNNGLASGGQNRSNSGQEFSNTGQPLGLQYGAVVEERTGTGQTKSNAGQNLALKWPQKNPERFLPVSKRILLAELQEIVNAWEQLPPPLKDGILAIVRGQPK
jgi:hypothetical protein